MEGGFLAMVEIYTTMFCGYCMQAKRLLDKKGVEYKEIDVGFEPGAREEMLARAGGRTSVPQIFIEGRNIGGCDELFALESRGELDSLLNAA
jgi:glutaredoxin 3